MPVNDILPKPNPLTEPADLVNLGHKCCKCQSRRVVYYISRPDYHFPTGAYCYACLLDTIKATRRVTNKRMVDSFEYRIPTPMPLHLFIRIKVDLGLEKPSDNPYF